MIMQASPNQSTFKVPLSELDKEPYHFEGELSQSWIEMNIDPEVAKAALEPSQIELNAVELDGDIKLGTDVIVKANIRVNLLVPCARCLEEAPLRVESEVTTLFSTKVADPTLHDEEAIDDEDDLGPEVERIVGSTLVMDDWIRECILIEIPMQVYCKEDCSGIVSETLAKARALDLSVPETQNPFKNLIKDKKS